MDAPRVSLGLPVYNGDRYLEEALESICSQTFRDFELIVSDNASTDRTSEICRKLAERDPRVRYFRNETNVGAAPNYNRVFALARGEFFKWVAHDDLYDPDYLLRCVEALDRDPGVVLAHSAAVDIDAEGKVLGEVRFALHTDSPRPHERFRYLTCVDHPCFQAFGLIRTDVLRRTPLIGSYVGSDRVLIAELALQGRFFESPETLFLHREHPQRSTRAIPDLRARVAWFDARARKAPAFPTLQIYGGYWGALRRSRPGLLETMRCSVQLLRWWKHNLNRVGRELRALLTGAFPWVARLTRIPAL